jgi:hypothetical protein
MNPRADYWKKQLNLQLHPEGGFYARAYRSDLSIRHTSLPGSFQGSRPVCTHIYYLLQQNEFSAFHRIQSDELWHHYDGGCLCIYEINKQGKLMEHLLGKDIDNNELPFCFIRAGNWFAASLKNQNSFCLAGCSVSPGFDFAEFEMGKKKELITSFPDCAEKILKYSKG